MISKIVNLIKSSNHVMALTGAGISTESGIPDFRSKGSGLWKKHDPAKMASRKYMLKHPKEFYTFNVPRWKKYVNLKPNVAHIALAKMEKEGFINGVITQNIDGLHYKAGSENLFEVHGHVRTYSCMRCGKKYKIEIIYDKFEKGEVPFKCNSCGGTLRTDVVLFGDKMSPDFYDAIREVSGCDLLIVIGSSLKVYPVAGIPDLCKKLVIINKEPTPFDSRAEAVVHDGAGKTLRKIAEGLGIEVN